MFVLTIDQENSRVVGDRVPELLELFGAHLRGRWAPVVEFSRSVGDEVQGVIESPWALWAAVRLALRSGGWYVGIGLGVVDEPLPVRSSEGSGEAFIAARDAVDDAKTQRGTIPVSVRGLSGKGAQPTSDSMSAHVGDVQALLRLLALAVQGRSAKAWEALDLLTYPDGSPRGSTQTDAAAELGISKQAMSARLKAARWDEEWGAIPLLVRLLDNLRPDQRS
ncbi:hypothetical protein [Jonesia denitrificans]|uniref:MarR family transcriptional regulator n=1 Tax=Jonesia denitrificans (strain ATCC 14870 / DSM 20603 / BCRC 15368 / CIP 55.134 / JCM 11481 / NBRC 15587 / NCTC 10816 / Prevot 55134) TaxID=471856 RepID=C7R4D1_JONDD|nr:hypothetical protein [Jonesia denitrificans]ACV08988.1 hypothetical protein Jden_1332 [Jonesia denitrificans DSM 20603]ASE09713.1 hypothetical protein CEP80_11680 [Jonesia denitrificans]QXB44252.1 hypothetical protein I6L70_05325 [Jonesia denitrificans]SQH21083.1 Uncharacterised protein [Jonesia denitrificans]